jgi:hypothetical protein
MDSLAFVSGPLVHEYYQFSDRILQWRVVVCFIRFQKILMDQTIYLTVKRAVYISAVGLLQGDDWKLSRTMSRTVSIVWYIYGVEIRPLVHCITLWFIPARRKFSGSTRLISMFILSTLARQEERGC